MTELFINNKKIYLNDSISIKLVDENSYFTDSSKYTYDVDVPLRGNANNLKILGNLQRLDVNKVIVKMPARIVSDNKKIIDGTATVTSVSEDKIKIQILSGNAELNFVSKYEKQHIDELKLGYAKRADGVTFSNDEEVWKYVQAMSEDDRFKFLYGKYGDANYVFFPAYKNDFDACYNNSGYLDWGETGNYRVTLHRCYWHETAQRFEWVDSINGRLAAQPYFCYIIRLVFEKLGYTLAENQIENTPLKNMFIANANNISDFGQCLPHWTISEFMTHVEHFFGVIFRIDDADKTVRVIARNSFYTAENTEYVDKVLNEYTVSSDADETKDLSDSNLSYSFSNNDPYLKVDEDIISKAQKKEFANDAELSAFWKSTTDENKCIYLYCADGKQYIDYKIKEAHSLKEVNQFRNLVRNESSESSAIELKIVPVAMMLAHQIWDNYHSQKFECPVMAPSDFSYDAASINMQNLIEGNGGTEKSQDIIEVAMNDGIKQMVTPEGSKFYYPYPFVRTFDELKGENNRGFSFELNEVKGRTTMYDTVFGLLNKVNTKSEYCIKFISDKMPDVMKRFIINNKAFICEKIEYKIDAKGIAKEKTGYFYEADS